MIPEQKMEIAISLNIFHLRQMDSPSCAREDLHFLQPLQGSWRTEDHTHSKAQRAASEANPRNAFLRFSSSLTWRWPRGLPPLRRQSAYSAGRPAAVLEVWVGLDIQYQSCQVARMILFLHWRPPSQAPCSELATKVLPQTGLKPLIC